MQLSPAATGINVNNYASLAAALTAASGKGFVYIPGGTTVSISSAVTCPANTGIRGDGKSSIISVTTASSVGINVPNAGCLLRDFNINYTSPGTAGGYGVYITNTADGAPHIDNVNLLQPYYGLYFNGANFVYASNLNVENATAIGVDVASSDNVILHNVSAANSAVNTYTSIASLYVFGTTSGMVVDGGEWYGASGQALFYSSSAEGNVITNAFFDSSTSSAEIATAADLTLSADWFSNGRSGAGSPGLLIAGGDRISIQSSKFYNSGSDGLLVTGGTHITINDNIFSVNGATAAGRHGLVIGTNVTDFSITGNTAIGNPGYGIFISGGSSTRYIVTGNLTTSNTTGGIGGTFTGSFYAPGIVGSGTSANF